MMKKLNYMSPKRIIDGAGNFNTDIFNMARTISQYSDGFITENETREKSENETGLVVFDDVLEFYLKAIRLLFTGTKRLMFNFHHSHTLVYQKHY